MWNVPGKAVDPMRFGPLRPVKTLYDFDGPKTFTFRDQDGELCLAHWCDEEANTTRYIAVAFSNRLVSQLEQGVLSVRDALEQPRAWVLDEDADGNIRSAWRVEVTELPEEVLPKSGALLLPALESSRSAGTTSKPA
jgi:hypothetical protein